MSVINWNLISCAMQCIRTLAVIFLCNLIFRFIEGGTCTLKYVVSSGQREREPIIIISAKLSQALVKYGTAFMTKHKILPFGCTALLDRRH